MTKNRVALIRAGVDITVVLEPHEELRLIECEAIIKADLKGFLAVGRALADIRDNRLYRETHKTFEKYCKDKWDLGKSTAYQKIDGYEAVALLESKKSAIADKNTPGSSPEMNRGIDPIDLADLSEKYASTYDERMAEAGAMCIPCGHRKAMINKRKGVKIQGHGKCTNPDGLCPAYREAAITASQGDMNDTGSEPKEIILPINEAQARPLTKLKDPDDQVKAWRIVLDQLNQGKKLTAALVNKAVKEVRGEVVKKKKVIQKKELESTQLVSNLFKKQYQVLLDIISGEQDSNWKTSSKKEVVTWLKNLVKIAEED